MAEIRMLRVHSLPAHACPVYGVHAGARSRWDRRATLCFPRAVRARFALRMRALVCGAGFKGRGLEMQSVLFPRPGCAGGDS